MKVTYSGRLRPNSAANGGDATHGGSVTQPARAPEEFSKQVFAAHFVQVKVDPDLGEVRVARIACAFGAGRIINPKTARTQVIGGIIGGIGLTLTEETLANTRFPQYVNPNPAQ